MERDAQLTLAAPADDVADVNDQVIDVVEGANGVVLNSRVTGTDESARATLEVHVPSATLDDTLAALSELANVQSRTEQAAGHHPHLRDREGPAGRPASRTRQPRRAHPRRDYRCRGAAASGPAHRRERAIADAKSELNEVETRAQLATVGIVITSEGAGTSDDDDRWSFGDALEDAGKVLEVGAGVALISAAVLLPLAIIAAIAYFVVSAANRRSREKALGRLGPQRRWSAGRRGSGSVSPCAAQPRARPKRKLAIPPRMAIAAPTIRIVLRARDQSSEVRLPPAP